MIGQRLLHYELTEKLGEGGMGVVYKARDTHLDRFVAIKVLPSERVADPGRKARFVQEAKAASALNHPNIIVVHDIAADAGVDFIAMEYVAGKTLEQLIGRKGLALNETLKHAIQISDALARAHAAGIVHRDLKPSNVMVGEHGLVKVLDFGLAKLTEPAALAPDAATETMRAGTEEGTIVGTAAYMSPEQAEGKPVDARSDIFSFGSLLYEMVSGQRAFQGDSKMSTLSGVLGKEPSPLPAETPPDLAKIVTRCLRKDPAKRFQHIDDVKVALDELKDDSESGKLAATGPAVKSRHRMLMWAAGGAGALALVAAGAWFLRPKPPAPTAALRAVPLTAHAGEETEPCFSPDGNQVAYSWNGEKQDNFDIYIKLIGPGAPLRLTTDSAPDRSPAWSPDGRWIAFLRVSHGGQAAVLLIPALGGPERKITEIDVTPENLYLYSHLTWTRDGTGLVVSHAGGGGERPGLFLVSTGTGAKSRLTTGSSLAPAISPDGRRLTYVRQSGMSACDLFVLDLSAGLAPQGESRRLTSLNEAVGGPAWTSDGREIVFSSGPHVSRRSMWRVAASPGSSPRQEPVGEDGTNVAISRDGRRLVYSRKVFDTDIWSITLRTRTEMAGPPARLISSTHIDANPQYSPDGKRIVFNSHRSGAEEIWIASADGAKPMQLTNAGGPMVANPRWSPDGQILAIHSMLGGVRGIDLISANGGAFKRVVEGGGTWPTWSRDGKWFYFGKGGQIWKVLQGGGEAIQVTKQGGSGTALESADGKYLYYVKRSRIWRAPLGGGEETQVFEEPLSYGNNFALVEDGLYLVSAPGFYSPGILYFYDFTSGRLTQVKTIKAWGLGLTVSPNGRTILYTQREQQTGSLMLVENFR